MQENWGRYRIFVSQKRLSNGCVSEPYKDFPSEKEVRKASGKVDWPWSFTSVPRSGSGILNECISHCFVIQPGTITLCLILSPQEMIPNLSSNIVK